MLLSSSSKAAGRVRSLIAKKEKIEAGIRREMSRRLPCSLTLSQLKKLKLGIKDRIALITSQNRRSGLLGGS